MKERIVVEGLKQRVEELSALLDVSSTVTGKVGVRFVMDLLVQKVRECLLADLVTLMLVERSSGRLVTYAASGIHEKEILGTEIAVEEGVEGWVVKEGEPMTFQKGRTSPGSTGRELPDVASLLAIPLKLDGVTIGVLTVKRFSGNEPFQEADLKLLSIFGNDAVMAIEKEIFHYNKPAFDRNDPLV
jgi:GAF domain-containing protein